jgi:predicted AlkP superfamily phosphohydrolase/phosphomutase
VAKLHEALHALDQSIGELAELAERRCAGLVVVSDHGFGPFRGKISIPELLAGRGLLSRSRLARRIGHRLSRAGFRARKWLSRRRRPGASTSALRRPLGMLAPIDWRTSRAVALHGDLAGLVYLNTPARFGRGPLTIPRLEDETLAETLVALRDARHPETAEPLFVDAYSVHERFGIDPLEFQWPEIIAIPADGYQTRTRMESHGELILADPQLTGTHRLKGVLMLPACARQSVPRQAEMRDVAPTLLTLLDLPCPDSMSGRSLLPSRQRRADDFHPLPLPHAEPPLLSSSQQSLVETRLRDLGYLD